MGGSYGYCIGYLDQGVYQPTKNLGRAGFALMADAPREERPDRQSRQSRRTGAERALRGRARPVPRQLARPA